MLSEYIYIFFFFQMLNNWLAISLGYRPEVATVLFCYGDVRVAELVENFGDVESRGLWWVLLLSFVFFCKLQTMCKIVLIFERLTHSRFSRSIIQCDFDSVGVRESVSVQLVRVIFFFY